MFCAQTGRARSSSVGGISSKVEMDMRASGLSRSTELLDVHTGSLFVDNLASYGVEADDGSG